MKTSLLDYHLPAGLIAKRPLRIRRSCRLLRLDRATGAISHHQFDELPALLSSGDLLVANDSAVIPARLLGTREPGGGESEILLLEKQGPRLWKAMVRPGRRLRPGAEVVFGDRSPFVARIVSSAEDGTRTVRFVGKGRFDEWLNNRGAMPLPPYIDRPAERSDHADYQTVFARHPGAVASPTAGLHFDRPLLNRLGKAGIGCATVTLHVGAGTFRPIRTETVEEHKLDPERCHAGVQTLRRIVSRKQSGRGRVIAVGTTVTRVLETLWADPKTATDVRPLESRTSLMIMPGHEFRAIDALITNFHLPRSSLIALVAAFAGLEPVMNAYRAAIGSGYRFYSYGDAMLII
jgi:S-adenosylmethionine:tRNA ribosyltransferase-isomerase